MNQHFNPNRIIFVDVKEKFQRAHMLSRDKLFDYVIMWFWKSQIYNDVIYVESYLFFSFRYFIPSFFRPFFLSSLFLRYVFIIYLFTDFTTCDRSDTWSNPQYYQVPAWVLWRIQSTSETDVNLSQGLRQLYESSVKYQSNLNSFP
jgi:hypothetical protein